MPAVLSLYQSAEENIFKGTVRLYEDTFKLMLVGAGYTPNANTHTVRADITSEVAAAGGYTTNGWELAPFVITRSGATTTVDLPDLIKTATAGIIPAFRWAVVYAEVTRNTVVNPLLFYVLGNDAPADIPATADGTNLVFQWNASGVWTS
jgi:hypothetical protein